MAKHLRIRPVWMYLVNAMSIRFKPSAIWVLDFRLLFVMAQVMWGSVLHGHAKVVWQSELAALCEMRQSAQRYTWIGLEKITHELKKNEDIRKQLQTEQQSVLMHQTYVGMCHASYMFSRANKLLKV